MTDLFALRLAQRLNDVEAAAHYAELAHEYSDADLLAALGRATRAKSQAELGRRFHVELRHSSQTWSGNGQSSLLAAVRVERRAVAVAIFAGDHISYTQVRQLSSARDRALASAVGFIHWIAGQFRLDSAAIESIPNGNEIQRQAITQAVITAFREQFLPVWEVSKQELLNAFGHPALRSRKELRAVVTDVWPVLAGTKGKTFIQDAAALGLHVLTERYFLN